MRKLRQHATYANVMSTIAVFMALGGVGWAATTLAPNSVGTRHLKNKAVTSPKIKSKAVGGTHIKADTINGAHVKEAQLGTVPSATNAAKLGNLGPATYNIGRAYAYVNEEGGIDAGRSRNVVDVTRLGLGVYCATLAAGINLATVAPLATLDKQDSATTIPPPSTSDDQGIVEWDSVPEDCPAGTLEFDSIKQGFASGTLVGNQRDDQSFTLLIP
jgi:hypothetical protein